MKITLTNPASSLSDASFDAQVTANNAAITAAIENTLSRDGTAPNQMQASLDMNSQRVLNLPFPQSGLEPVRLMDVSTGATISGSLGKANNLSDVASIPAVKTNLGLDNVDNTRDVNKPVSSDQAAANQTVASNAATATSAVSLLKANIASPTFTGVPAAPTAALGTNTTQLATTAFVLANNSPVTLSGTNTWTGDDYFRSGRPWADVRAWGALGNNVTDDAPAIQAAINFMSVTYNGGIVFFPPGNYHLGSGIIIKTGVILIGCGKDCTSLSNQTANNFNLITFDTSCSFAGIEKLFIVGYTGASPITVTIFISNNVPVVIRDCYIWGGAVCINNQGTDGLIENCFIQPWGTGAVLSNGANWYIRCKFDAVGGVANAYAFQQGNFPPGGVAENHFSQCDFSGSYTDSIIINDGSNTQAISVFEGCVFSSRITLTSYKWTCFSACEIGSPSFNYSGTAISVVGCYAFSSISLPGISKAGNINIT